MDMQILIFCFVSVLMSMICYPQNTQYIAKDIWTNILPCIPFFILGLCISLDEDTYKIVNLLNCLAIIANSLYMIYFLSSGRMLGGSHGEDYSMHSSYLLLPNTLIAIDCCFRSRKLFPAICSGIGIVYAFAMGTRGPIVILAAFIMICIWRYINLRTGKKLIIITVLGIVVLVFVLSPVYMLALLEIRNFLMSNNVSTRVVDYLINGKMLSETGRDGIYIDLFNKLKDRPLLGYGAYGEYPFGYPAGAHNIYLQMVFQFGYPLGILLMIGYIAVFIKAWIETNGKLSQGWIALFGCLVFVKGIFGGNWLDYTVFFLLGFCLKEIRESRFRCRQV